MDTWERWTEERGIYAFLCAKAVTDQASVAQNCKQQVSQIAAVVTTKPAKCLMQLVLVFSSKCLGGI